MARTEKLTSPAKKLPRNVNVDILEPEPYELLHPGKRLILDIRDILQPGETVTYEDITSRVEKAFMVKEYFWDGASNCALFNAMLNTYPMFTEDQIWASNAKGFTIPPKEVTDKYIEDRQKRGERLKMTTFSPSPLF